MSASVQWSATDLPSRQFVLLPNIIADNIFHEGVVIGVVVIIYKDWAKVKVILGASRTIYNHCLSLSSVFL